jgi:hypothetical protein
MSPAQTQLAMTVPMMPDLADFAGSVHGGGILKRLDQVAYACASRYAFPPLLPATPEQHRRFAAAETRRRLRHEFEQRYCEMKRGASASALT